jgi:Na+-driven multidrug efflux pump
MILGQALRGAGDTRATLVVTFIGIWLVRIVVGYLLGIALGLGLFGMWIGWLADFAVRAVMMYTRFRAGKWKTLKI